MSAAYKGRESGSTRNPHSASAPGAKQLKEWSKLSCEERVLTQWRAAFGCPVSDEAKAQFCIHALDRTFRLSDVRLWTQHHPLHGKHVVDGGKVHLEFFFDGTTSELTGHEEEFTKAFENMIEQQLQERRVIDFRKKLATRRRRGTASPGEGDMDGGDGVDDEDWNTYLKKPVPATDFSIRSYREAGCMLMFLVCQTSVSVSASEVLGQIAFQEHFPIDGVAQPPSTSTMPLPRWFYGLGACTVTLSFFAVVAWWQVFTQIALAGGEAVLTAA
mmetsp:Transcript_30904/g.78251  ORF Transcript_30904/g.78251 Transcript_30904/m.78251 type:complete len:273 (+) Transcript_30904:2-820(+)